MSEEKVVAGTAQPAKKLKRGVSNETKAVNRLSFHEKDAAKNSLFIGHLHEVTVDWSKNENVFNGIAVPRLVFHFESNHENENERRHAFQSLFPVASSIDTIPGGKDEWRVNNIFAWIKHVLDIVYLKGRALTPAEEDALTLSFVDYDENNTYVPVETEDVIEGYRSLFENAAAMLNGTFNLKDGESAKPCYKTADGKYVYLWLKLLRHKKRKGEWVNVGQNGELAFDGFIGNGVIELYKPNTAPAILTVDFARESITPKEVKTSTSKVMDAINGIGGIAIGGAANMNEYNEAIANQGDMPF